MLLAPILTARGASPLSLSVSPLYILEITSATSGTTEVATLTISGGVAPYTAVWASSNSPTIVASSPTSTVSSAFNWTGAATDVGAVITITVTDSVGQPAVFYLDVTIIKLS